MIYVEYLSEFEFYIKNIFNNLYNTMLNIYEYIAYILMKIRKYIKIYFTLIILNSL